MIKISNISKSYGDKIVLDDFSLEIPQGSIVGLLGVNRAGKTTLLSILNGLIQVDSGSIEVFGYDLSKERKKINALSSIIPQKLAFYENLSVKENLDFFGDLQSSSKTSFDKAVKINALEPLFKQKASTLSGGQKRRLNIAIGLLNNPKVLYFDEPTVGVDPKTRNEILQSIKMYKDLGITVVYTSHYMSEVESICDTIAIMKNGKLVKHDTIENLLIDTMNDMVIIEVVYKNELDNLSLNCIDKGIIELEESKLIATLELLKKNKIIIKQIKYASNNLEKYFINVTGEHNV